MILNVRHRWQQMRDSFWFMPGVIVLGGHGPCHRPHQYRCDD